MTDKIDELVVGIDKSLEELQSTFRQLDNDLNVALDLARHAEDFDQLKAAVVKALEALAD